MDLQLDGKTALVTGASRGIGRAIAQALHAEGCHVALNARSADALQETASALGPRTSQHAGDVTDPAACARLLADVVAGPGAPDILVLNVGSGASVPPGQETAAEMQRMLELNLLSASNMVEAARPHLSSGAAIVAVSSIVAKAALGAPATYSAAKAGLEAYLRSIARPLGAEGIRVLGVAPGNVYFEGGTWDRKLREDPDGVAAMLQREVPLQRLAQPSEIADAVTFLASPRASFATGQIYAIDGGQLRS